MAIYVATKCKLKYQGLLAFIYTCIPHNKLHDLAGKWKDLVPELETINRKVYNRFVELFIFYSMAYFVSLISQMQQVFWQKEKKSDFVT